jgi:hypothetical protein
MDVVAPSSDLAVTPTAGSSGDGETEPPRGEESETSSTTLEAAVTSGVLDTVASTPLSISAAPAVVQSSAGHLIPAPRAVASAPGQVGQIAAEWSQARTQESASLSAQFVDPAIMVAARTYGFGPVEVAAAVELAGLSRETFAAAVADIDHAFRSPRTVASMPMVAPAATGTDSVEAHGDVGVRPTTPVPVTETSEAAVEATPTTAGFAPALVAHIASKSSAGLRLPRGAFLWPEAVASAMGLTAKGGVAAAPRTAAAMDLVAALKVYAALGDASAEAAVESWTDAGPAAVAETDEFGVAQPATEVATSDAGAYYTFPGLPDMDSWDLVVPPAMRAQSPAVRAARAYSVASQRATNVQDRARLALLTMPAFAPVADEWLEPDAVVPEGPDRGAQLPSMTMLGGTQSSAATTAPSSAATHTGAGTALAGFSGDMGVVSGEASRPTIRAATMAGAPLMQMVEPTPQYVSETRERSASYFTGPTAQPELVATGASRSGQVVSERPQPSTASSSKSVAGSTPSWASGGELPAWFQEAASKFLGGAGDGRGLNIAEMTLISTAPRTQVAASTRSVSAPPVQVSSQTAGAGTSVDAPPSPDIDELAQEVYEEIMRMLEIARERNGDPWQQT